MKGMYNLDKKFKSVKVENCYNSEITLAELKFGVENSQNPEKKIDILLFPLEKGITIPISRLTFDNKTQVTESGIGEIDRLVHLLEQYPDMKIDLHGPKLDA
jgi:hypothetical protein